MGFLWLAMMGLLRQAWSNSEAAICPLDIDLTAKPYLVAERVTKNRICSEP